MVETKRKKLLAVLFLEGANKKLYGSVLTKLKSDFALGSDLFPVGVEDALSILIMREKKTSQKAGGEEPDAFSGAQVSRRKCFEKRLCFKCGKAGHRAKECPSAGGEAVTEKEDEKKKTASSSAQVVHREEFRWME